MAFEPIQAGTWSDIATGTVGPVTTGMAILLIGVWAVLTYGSFSYNSPLAILSWSLYSVIAILMFIGVVPLEAMWTTAAVTALAIGITGAYDAR